MTPSNTLAMSSDVHTIRTLYNEKVVGMDFPRWGKFNRECIGELLQEVDRLVLVANTATTESNSRLLELTAARKLLDQLYKNEEKLRITLARCKANHESELRRQRNRYVDELTLLKDELRVLKEANNAKE